MIRILQLILSVIFVISLFIIFWAMIGYPLSLKIISKFYSCEPLKKNQSFLPSVTVMVVAHNEEKVIQKKLENLISMDYPLKKCEILVASDNSNDKTNEIVSKFIETHTEYNIRLYVTKEHKGKTNAQNEAQKTVNSDILVMTDANSMFKTNAIRELVSCFVDDNIAYVTGRLSYYENDYQSSNAESTYWNNDLKQRIVESSLHSVTAGNGAIYACRNYLYYDFDPVSCHDSAMPRYYAKKNMRSVYNPDAIAYEKAGETTEDEFKRKVRMNREIVKDCLTSYRYMNPFKLSWFAYCYFGHRYCRYHLWISHITIFVTNLLLFIISNGFYKYLFGTIFMFQSLFYIIAFVGKISKSSNKYIYIAYYYVMTIFAQLVGAIKEISGKSKPTWEKAETTR